MHNLLLSTAQWTYYMANYKVVKFPEPKLDARKLYSLKNIEELLSPRQKEVFKLLYYEGKTRKEIVENTGMYHSNVSRALAVIYNKIKIFGTDKAFKSFRKSLGRNTKSWKNRDRVCTLKTLQRHKGKGELIFLTPQTAETLLHKNKQTSSET